RSASNGSPVTAGNRQLVSAGATWGVAGPFAAFHGAVEVGELLAALWFVVASRRHDGRDAVDAEGAEIRAHLAPGNQRPDLAPEPEAERAHVAGRGPAGLVAIVERQHLALFDRTLDAVDMGAVGVAHHPHRR